MSDFPTTMSGILTTRARNKILKLGYWKNKQCQIPGDAWSNVTKETIANYLRKADAFFYI